ncbi:alpha/beta hydrolase [Nocardioides mangrovicus]|uniref:Alpha/beta hydrolase n=1 Tax=Nocardioides mangrovicus TaxID=2478913 RepID=A0A3L8NZY6_9ACTN|nr:alpha/beta hydrolase [Nocardioides mangrovicus]RLV48745.1 alpha/beta hydrolase [Nocardioides mangrovicus]
MEETTDVLGAPYVARTIPLAADEEGEVVATLVSRRAPGTAKGAVLHVHGFADYFFQTHLADWWVERGWDFHAVDLRKYGRSWLPHQTPTYVADLATYDEDLDAAYRLVAAEQERVVLTGHSTGGLVLSLWLDRVRPAGVVGLVLNSPWLEMNAGPLLRTVGTTVIDVVGARRPMRVVSREVTGDYARSLHRDHDGEWDFDLRWKPLASFEVRTGWLRAIRRAHARLHRGLDVGVPVLVQSSTRSTTEKAPMDVVSSTDVVLDVDQIRRWAPSLGRHVTIAQTEGAMHDVYLSRQPARDAAFDELGRWVGAYLG